MIYLHASCCISEHLTHPKAFLVSSGSNEQNESTLFCCCSFITWTVLICACGISPTQTMTNMTFTNHWVDLFPPWVENCGCSGRERSSTTLHCFHQSPYSGADPTSVPAALYPCDTLSSSIQSEMPVAPGGLALTVCLTPGTCGAPVEVGVEAPWIMTLAAEHNPAQTDAHTGEV